MNFLYITFSYSLDDCLSYVSIFAVFFSASSSSLGLSACLVFVTKSSSLYRL